MTDYTPELDNYRAHRYAITKLHDTDDFALFDPSGTLIAIGAPSELAPLILSGPDHYETCAEAWSLRTRHNEELSVEMASLFGHLTKPKPIALKRRF